MGFLFAKCAKLSMMGTLEFVLDIVSFCNNWNLLVLSLDDCL